jgi:osmoprotectant transport system permease protein
VIVVAAAVAERRRPADPRGNRVVRVAPGAGFWVLLAAVGLMATDAITRLRPRPATRVLMLALFGGQPLAWRWRTAPSTTCR